MQASDQPDHLHQESREPCSYSSKMSLADWFVLALASGAFLGFVPPRVATLGTALGVPLALALNAMTDWAGYLVTLVVLWLLGIPICGRAATVLRKPDPREVVYDEFSTLPLVYFLAPAFDWQVLAIGFVAHRFFDIIKPFGIRRLERLPGGIGIMVDDIAASICGFATLQSMFFLDLL